MARRFFAPFAIAGLTVVQFAVPEPIMLDLLGGGLALLGLGLIHDGSLGG